MTYKTLWQSLAPAYEVGEAKAIVDYVLDIRFGMSKADVICGALDEMPADERLALQHIMQRLQQAEPVQYVLGQADFCGRVFAVNPSVLIPRPETEELCHWIAQEHRHRQHLQVLDLCTGSGCIAITLALALPQSRVAGFDISQEALRTAQHNAGRLGAEVDFMPVDVLAPMPANRQWDIIVSNPPYICDREKKDMADNVLRHEPHLALFVPLPDGIVADIGKLLGKLRLVAQPRIPETALKSQAEFRRQPSFKIGNRPFHSAPVGRFRRNRRRTTPVGRFR